jgi:hypothetical protein
MAWHLRLWLGLPPVLDTLLAQLCAERLEIVINDRGPESRLQPQGSSSAVTGIIPATVGHSFAAWRRNISKKK